MNTTISKPATIDEYIAAQPPAVQPLLQQMRQAVRQGAPHATEVISYGMPAIKLHGVLVYYAAAKNHMGFYPTPSALIAFKKELAGYAGSKGAVQFPLHEPLPLALVTEMTAYRAQEDAEKAAIKATAKKKK